MPACEQTSFHLTANDIVTYFHKQLFNVRKHHEQRTADKA